MSIQLKVSRIEHFLSAGSEICRYSYAEKIKVIFKGIILFEAIYIDGER